VSIILDFVLDIFTLDKMVAKPLDFNNENEKYEERSSSRNSNNSNSKTICNGNVSFFHTY